MHLEGIDYRGYLNGRTYGFWQATCGDDWRVRAKQNEMANDLILDSIVTLMRGGTRHLKSRVAVTSLGPSAEGVLRFGFLIVKLSLVLANAKAPASEESKSLEAGIMERGALRLYGFVEYLVFEIETRLGRLEAALTPEQMQKYRKRAEKLAAEIKLRLDETDHDYLPELRRYREDGRATAIRELERFPWLDDLRKRSS